MLAPDKTGYGTDRRGKQAPEDTNDVKRKECGGGIEASETIGQQSADQLTSARPTQKTAMVRLPAASDVSNPATMVGNAGVKDRYRQRAQAYYDTAHKPELLFR